MTPFVWEIKHSATPGAIQGASAFGIVVWMLVFGALDGTGWFPDNNSADQRPD